MKKKLLFTGGGGAGNEAIWRLLSNKYEVYFADCNIEAIDSLIPEENRIEILQANDSSFIENLIKVCSRLEIDILIPGVDEELLQLAEQKKLFNCLIYLPDSNFVECMLNKYDCANKIKAAGLDAPKTYYINDWPLLKLPMIVKPKSGRGSRGVMAINTEEELSAYRVFNKYNDNDLIVQELIIGTEYTVFVSANKFGELNCIIPVKVNQKRGVTISAVTENNDKVIEYVKNFHRKFKTKCIYNLQCILTDQDEVFPFEINPRISTTFCMALAAEFDPFKEFHKTTDTVFKINKQVNLQRNWKNTLTTL